MSATGAVLPLISQLQGARSRAQSEFEVVDSLLEQVRNALFVDPIPRQFAGYIRDYRFRSGAIDELPKHTMRVVVDSSLVLWISVPSSVFEPNIVKPMNGEKMSKLNGRLVLCERNPTYGVVPMQLLEPLRTSNDVTVGDSRGRSLYKNCPVVSERGQGVATKISTDGFVVVKYDDRGSLLKESASNITRLT